MHYERSTAWRRYPHEFFFFSPRHVFFSRLHDWIVGLRVRGDRSNAALIMHANNSVHSSELVVRHVLLYVSQVHTRTCYRRALCRRQMSSLTLLGLSKLKSTQGVSNSWRLCPSDELFVQGASAPFYTNSVQQYYIPGIRYHGTWYYYHYCRTYEYYFLILIIFAYQVFWSFGHGVSYPALAFAKSSLPLPSLRVGLSPSLVAQPRFGTSSRLGRVNFQTATKSSSDIHLTPRTVYTRYLVYGIPLMKPVRTPSIFAQTRFATNSSFFLSNPPQYLGPSSNHPWSMIYPTPLPTPSH